MMKVKRYKPDNPMLKSIVKYYWFLESDSKEINRMLLPVSNIDVIIYLSNTINCEGIGETMNTGNSYIISVKNGFLSINQQYVDKAIGISFTDAGFGILLKDDFYSVFDSIVNLENINSGLSRSFIENISRKDDDKAIDKIENILIIYINKKVMKNSCSLDIINAYSEQCYSKDINAFCREKNIHRRTFERLFKQYVGLSPNHYKRIKRFQNVVKSITTDKQSRLTDIVYDCGYFDQSHMIKDFNLFSGYSPKAFINKKPSILQHQIIL